MSEAQFLESLESLVRHWQEHAEGFSGDVYSAEPETMKLCAEHLNDLLQEYYNS